MSRHNYTQYSSKKHNVNEFETETLNNVKMEYERFENENVEQEVVKPASQSVVGIVANCTKLNVRTEPAGDSDIVCVLPAKTELKIDVDKSTDEWFAVYTAAGVEGYCMQKYIDTRM